MDIFCYGGEGMDDFHNENEEGLLCRARWNVTDYIFVFSLLHPLLRVNFALQVKFAILILLTLLAIASVVKLFLGFLKGIRMGMSEKGGTELTITVWASILAILLTVILLWKSIFPA